MKKTLALLVLMIALLPACKKNSVVTVPVSQQPYTSAVSDDLVEAMPQQDDVAAFELQEDENPFNTASLEEELMPVTVETQMVTEDQNKYGFKDIYYGFDQYEINQDQKAALEQNKAIAKSLAAKNNTIVLEGHACDSAGSSEYNFMLSEKRAERVADKLVACGIDRKQIYTKGCGAEKLKIKSGDRNQQAPNRRVEFYAYPANTQEAIA